jgi:hypothetical protein
VIDYVAGTGQDQQGQRLTRERIYRYNQIPAVVLGRENLERPNWDEDLYQGLQQMYHQSFDPMRYVPVDTNR